MAGYEFSNSWFDVTARKLWQEIVTQLKPKRYLEIGSYEGASLRWICENTMAEEARCIDTWEGSPDLPEEKMIGVEERFLGNVETIKSKLLTYPKIIIHKQQSVHALASMLAVSPMFDNYFDMIYIDGSHLAVNVLQDACMAWPLLTPGKLMFFDDYLWRGDAFHRTPKPAIDAFCNIHCEDACVIRSGPQVVVQKRITL